MKTENAAQVVEMEKPKAKQTAVSQEERELVSRLKSAIDRNGRYSYRLDDMAAGYAAGKDVSPTQARLEIEKKFAVTYSCTPKEYLDQRHQVLEQEKQNSRGMTR